MHGPESHLLRSRFAALRRRLRFVTAFRGGSWLIAFVLALACVAGGLDWFFHLPGVLRAVFLVGLLGGGGVIAYRGLVRPLRVPADDLSLALRIEARYPALNDALASTVQFLEQPTESPAAGSASLRQRVVKQALRLSRECNFNQVIDARGLRLASVSLVAATGLAVALVVLYPALAFTAAVRLADPFGSRDWTGLHITATNRIAQGSPFELRGELHGVIPAQATVVFRCGDAVLAEQSCTIRPGARPDDGSLVARLEPSQVQRTFRFQVQANDAVSAWQEVEVVPPPELVRDSLMIRVAPPAYTGQPEYDLLDRGGTVEVVAGTQVRLRALTNRAVAYAWLELHRDRERLRESLEAQHLADALERDQRLQQLTADRLQWGLSVAAQLAPLAAAHLPDALSLATVGQLVGGEQSLRLSADGRRLEGTLMPLVDGRYAVGLRDDTGLEVVVPLLDLAIKADPAPAVHIERPYPGLDLLTVLPSAEIGLRAVAEDQPDALRFGIRSAFLEYRCAKDEPPRRLPLYAHASAEVVCNTLLPCLAGAPLAVPLESLRLRPQRLEIVRRLPLTLLTHADGSPLRPGDVVSLQVGADDFDDVWMGKRPGYSQVLELRIVDLSALQSQLDQAQAEVQQKLLRLREQQRQARERVEAADRQWQKTGKLRSEDQDRLVQAEQLQQQIQAQMDERQETSVRADIARIQRALRDNQVPRSGAHERMELAAAELDRLAQEELDKIEPLLAAAREENDEQTTPLSPERMAELAGKPQSSPRTAEQLARAARERARLLQTDPKQLPPELADRAKLLDRVADDLQRLAQAELQPENPLTPAARQKQERWRERLDEIRKQADAREREQALRELAQEMAHDPKEPLKRALRHQEETEKTLDQLLAELVPYSTIREVKGQAKALLEEQNKLNQQTERLSNEIPQGEQPANTQQRAELSRAAEQQQRLGQNSEQLLDKMARLTEEKEASAQQKRQLAEQKRSQADDKREQAQQRPDQPQRARLLEEEARTLQEEARTLEQQAETLDEEVAALKEAENLGRQGMLKQQLRDAARNIRANKLGEAANQQQRGTEAMEKVVKALEVRREDELDRLLKKMRQAERKLQELADEQERLQKKVKDANEIKDAQQRDKELHRLAREQEKLRERVQEMARELTRLRAQRAGHELGRAGGQMEDAGRQLTRDQGDEAQDRQDEALDRLDEARRELQRAREQIEEELARERLAKIADQLKRVKERQEGLLAEADRIHKSVLQKGNWDDGLTGSLGGLAEAQHGLSEETASLAEKLAGALIFGRMLDKATEAMEQAGQQMRQRQKKSFERFENGQPLDQAAEKAADEAIQQRQREALRRLDQLLEALQPEKGVSQRPANNGGEPNGKPRGEGDNIPPLAQLKALRALQAEVNKRTEEFGRQHPDLEKLTEKEKAELRVITEDQKEVADLLEKLTTPAQPEGGNP